jgi:hypothetical protein
MTSKVVAISLLSLLAAGAATLSIDPSSTTVPIGDQVSLNIKISGVTDLFAFQFDLGFDPTVLSASSISEGSFLPIGGATVFIAGTIDNVGGTISGTADSLSGAIPGVTGDGVLATAVFNAVGLGTSTISISNITLLDSSLNPIDSSSTGGSVDVVASLVPEPGSALTLLIGLLILLSPMLLRCSPARRFLR